MAKRKGALSRIKKFAGGGAVDADDTDAQDLMMSNMAAARSSGSGALSQAAAQDDDSDATDATDDPGASGAESASPQDMRNLKMLAYAKGMMAPMHTGAPLLEGYGNVASNELALANEHMKMNAQLRAKLAAINASKSASERISQEQIEGRNEVAKIMAGKNAETLLSDDDLQQAGLPPGTTAATNAFGKIRVIHSPPATQQMLTGFDGEGKPMYAAPGAALTPAVRSQYQTFLKNSQSVAPMLDDLIERTDPDQHPDAQSAMGASGTGERLINATVGQGAQLLGMKKGNFFKDDTKLRDDTNKFNELAMSALSNHPVYAGMGQHARDDIKGLLPDMDAHGADLGTVHQKLVDFKNQLTPRISEAQMALKGQGMTNQGGNQQIPSGQPDVSIQSMGDYSPQSGRGQLPNPPTPQQIDVDMVVQHARAAIAAGADPKAVAKRAKDKYGIDIGAQ